MREDVSKKNRQKGLEIMDAVYGKGFTKRLNDKDNLILNNTLGNLFAEIWNRPGLSIKDRRLLTMGATVATGEADTLKIQATGALKNKELTADELREAALHLAYYAGWEKGMKAAQAFEAAIESIK